MLGQCLHVVSLKEESVILTPSFYDIDSNFTFKSYA